MCARGEPHPPNSLVPYKVTYKLDPHGHGRYMDARTRVRARARDDGVLINRTIGEYKILNFDRRTGNDSTGSYHCAHALILLIIRSTWNSLTVT